MRVCSSSPVARRELQGGVAWSTGARCPVSPSRHTRTRTLENNTRAHTHTHMHGLRRTQMAPRYKRRSGCVSDLPDVSGNFRSMIYMGITSTDQISIKSTKEAPTADRSVIEDLFASPWISTRHTPIPPLFLSFFLWLSILGVHIHTHAHTHAQTLHYNYLLYCTTSTQRGSLNSNDPSDPCAAQSVKCVIRVGGSHIYTAYDI